MAITVNQENRIFTIHTNHSSYQMKVDDYGFLLHLYYGRKICGEADYLLTFADRGFSGNPYDVGNDRTYSMDFLPQEYPVRGAGDFRSPALDVRNADGSFGCDLRCKGYEIKDGKYALPGLPAVYAEKEEAQTLEMILEDTCSGLEVTLLYGVLPESDIITRSVKITNHGEKEVLLEKVQSACLDFVCGDFDLLTFYGRHMMERNVQRSAVGHGSFRIGSRRGSSSHQYNPMMILAERDATEDTGVCYAMSFVYSGGFLGEAGKDQFHQTRIQLGLMEEEFSYPLKPGESFYAPEVIMSCSKEGLGELSRNLHRCIRRHICRGKYKTAVRPVLVNSWEAAYMDFTGEIILNLAKEASALGMEMLVLDDGWFGMRNDDNRGLGDWRVNEEKLGCSLKELIDKINGMGLKFGIWIEPEMVNEDSDLYRQHPDWALALPGKKPVRSRNQLVLDFSRKEVVDEIFRQICGVLDQGNVEYLKWDMNRSIADVYSYAAAAQGKVLYDYVLGLYDFLERLLTGYPDLLIEGCSGGGGRFDAGMLYYTPQIWCSDNTDAIDRIKIQYGTSFGYPMAAMGSHVSAAPNHQTGRCIPLKTRGIVAMSGVFGYELDLCKLTEEEKEEIRDQIRKYHQYAFLLQNGDFYRLSNPFTEEAAAWEMVSEDKSEALVQVVMLQIHGNMPTLYIRLKGLERGKLYREEESGKVYPADILMEAGLPILAEPGDFQGMRMHFVRVDCNGQ